ncbi:MAG: hypothetical protein NZO58_00935 [Gemmataceae bacterium]|nr:hypothetical protein [Gemmataceae bacterium]
MNTARWLGLTLLPAALALLAGCGRAPLTPVQGRVAYKGVALQSGVIVFTPDTTRGERGAIAVGRIREDGTYTLYTGDTPGVSAGWYRVTVSAMALPSSTPPGVPAYPQSLLPEKYRDPTQSMLACEVKPSRTNYIDFNLD